MPILIQRVVVAGAGLAGLAVANELARAGRTVTIVEARDRIGGRAWTVRAAFREGAFGELGAEFIDDDHRRVRGLAQRLGIATVRVLRRGFTLRCRGDSGEFALSRVSGWDDLARAMAPLVRDYKRAHGSNDSTRVRELATFSVQQWLQHQNAPRHVHSVAEAMRGFFLADAGDLSALPMAAELSQEGSPAQTPMHRLVGGTERLVAALSTAADARLLLNHRLQSVRHGLDRVICEVLDDTGRQQQIEADALVLTLPASTLRDVAFTPALPDDQWRAIRALRYGCATKAVVQTSSDLFGGRPARAFGTDTHAGAFWDAAEGQPPGAFVTSFLAGGSASGQLAERLRHGADMLLSDLCWLRRVGPSPRTLASVHHQWEADPFARGGYAYLDPGFDPAWLALLGRRAGRLFFAGEHTSQDFQGYMEGALQSAERVISEIHS